jgi:hypothetical protein
MAIDVRALAREGARIRLAELLAAFPDLLNDVEPRKANGAAGHGMSDAQRKAVSERMKAYWANQRAEKAKKKKG